MHGVVVIAFILLSGVDLRVVWLAKIFILLYFVAFRIENRPTWLRPEV